MNQQFKIQILATLFVLISLLCAACAGNTSYAVDDPLGERPKAMITDEINLAYFEQMRVLEAEERWDDLAKLAGLVLSHAKLDDSQRGWGHYYAARVFLEKAEGRRTLANARAAEKLLPNEVKPKILLGLAELRFGNTMKAENILFGLTSQYPASLEVNLGMGKANEIMGHWNAARNWYEKAAKLSPNDGAIRSKVALMFWRAGYGEEAAKEFEAALALNPNDAISWNDKGIVNLALGRTREALADFSRAIEILPTYCDALLNRANYYAAKQKYTQALEDCDAGLAVEPKNVGLLIARAQVYRQKGLYLDASSGFETAYTFERNNLVVLNELAWFLATCPVKDLRNGERAIFMAEAAAGGTSTPDPGIYDTLGAAYAEGSRFEDAVKVQTTAVELARHAGFASDTIAAWTYRLKLYREGRAYHE